MLVPTESPSRTVSLPDAARPGGHTEEVIGLRDRETGNEYAIDPDVISHNVGSAAGCDVRLENDPYVSQLHVVLVRKRDQLHVIDKSKNGSYINNSLVEHGFLRDGAHLQVGKTTLIAFSLSSRSRLTPLEYLRGSDDAFAATISTALALAATRAHALILGEPGVGKRTLAALIHQESPRACSAFVTVDCDALPSARVEPALIEAVANARGGTLLVHGLEHLPPDLHGLLRRAISDTDDDIRVIATSSQPDVETRAGYQWLRDSATVLKLPALRERWSDIPILVHLFLDEFRAIAGPKRIAAKTLAALCGYDWPGNVQQLREAVRRSVALSDGPDLRFELFWPDAKTAQVLLKRAVTSAWHQHGSIRKAAEALAMPKSSYAKLVEQLGLKK